MSLGGRVKILSQLFLNEELTLDLVHRLKRKLEKMKRLGLEALMIWSKDTGNLDRPAGLDLRPGRCLSVSVVSCTGGHIGAFRDKELSGGWVSR